MINRIIDEIKVCLNMNCFIAALSAALTLPDVCGKAEFPKVNNRKRYVDWYNIYIGNYELNNFPFKRDELIDGDIIYSLRNNVFHQGSLDINEKCNIDTFELLIQEPNRNRMDCSFSGFSETFYEGKKVLNQKRIMISVVDIILKICKCSRNYYNNNKSKFVFLHDKIEFVPPELRGLIGNDLVYDKCFKLNSNQTKIKWDDFI